VVEALKLADGLAAVARPKRKTAEARLVDTTISLEDTGATTEPPCKMFASEALRLSLAGQVRLLLWGLIPFPFGFGT
jgi:hypothetical protein